MNKLSLLAMLLACVQLTAATTTLTWDASSATNVTYRLYQSTGGPFTIVQIDIHGTLASVLYDSTVTNRWFVTAYSTNYGMAESLPSNTLQLDPVPVPPIPGPPPPPTNLRATQVNGNRLDLGWTASLVYSSRIDRAPPNGAFTQIGETAPGTLHFITSAKPKDKWWFRVRSCDRTCSEPSDPLYWAR